MNVTIDSIDHKGVSRLSGHRLLLLGAAALMAAPVPAAAETLMDAVAAAYAGNPTLVAQRYRQKSINENYVQTRAQYGPSLSVTAGARYDYSKLRASETSSKSGNAALNLRQQVYSGGRVRGQLEEARANVLASQEQLRRIEGETVQNVIIVYAAVLRDQRRLEVARENVEVLREQLDARRARRRVRDVTITDIAQADARLAAGETQFANAEAQLAISRGEYLRVVGREPVDLAPLPELPGMPVSIDEAFDIAESENANLAAARRIEEASRANIASERGNQRPTAAIQAQAGKVGDIDPLRTRDFRTEVAAQVTITQPLWQGGAIRSRIRQAQDQNNVQQAVVDGERRQALQDVVLAWNQLGSSRIAVVSGTRQVEAAQIAFAGMGREESYGLRSTIEVLNAEQELASAQLQLLSARFQEYVSRSSLLLAMGRLDARTVNSAIPAKDPSAEFKRVRWRGMLPTDPAMMLLDHVGSAKLYPKRKPDLRGKNQPKPTGQPDLPATPDKRFTDAPLLPIKESPLITSDKLPDSVKHYETAPTREEPR
jgi:outer membrane protein